jgi:hypothetical protein
MKIILSRKGFDGESGGCASPILEDGTLLSMPIPGKSLLKFSEIKYGDLTYDEMWKQLNPKGYIENSFCHLDPDIRTGVRIHKVKDWIPAFGQVGAAQAHLERNKVGVGDVFLFFGWYRAVENQNGILSYKRYSRDLQLIYGYLQIGSILKGEDTQKLSWHPHSDRAFETNNTIYTPTDKLVINGEDIGLPGYGVLKYSDDVVLTKENCSRSKWKLMPWMEKTSITYHINNKLGVDVKDRCFNSAARGQEFVVYENDEATEWMKNLIVNNYAG